jgi:transketolase
MGTSGSASRHLTKRRQDWRRILKTADHGKRKHTFDERVAFLTEKTKEVRSRIIDMIYKAKSGHPGGALSAADIVTALYFDILRVDPANPRWPDRDRFLLSKGHACPVVYSCLAMRGYFGLEHLDTLRQFGSILQGHPIRKTPGIDMTTGSLGHGLSIGLGMALDGKLRGKDYDVYVMLGDGEINEGLVWEAAMAAAKFRIDNLVAIVDRNRLQMDGCCDDVMPMGDIAAKFKAFGWKTYEINGHDMAEILRTIEKARKVRGKPACIVANTVKGKGVSYMEDRFEWHGKCPDADQLTCAMKEIWGEDS